MQQISSTRKITGFLLLACIIQACYSATVTSSFSASSGTLMCYVCENCAKITKQTPLAACDAEFFDKDSSTTMETTTDPPATSPTTTTEVTTTTTDATTTTTTTVSTQATTTGTTGTTEEPVPTAPTVGPLPTTTAMPTPPNVGTISTDLAIADVREANNNTEDANVSLALPLVSEDYTYHCYSVQKDVNGSVSVERGCTRVTTLESVCGHLTALNNGTKLEKCVPCTNSACNGSSALAVSVATLAFAMIAVLLSRH
ncbi:unnamed protein product [Ceratitis capitata]|uniref:(Mediterranean fruit fly) hypothetical protein n=1 Tax=Ceratitis capitata TaxID=7213 RepID=A0A811UMA9_CERCA|nr:unnamed protein product [Ceratitis capitata]